MNDHRDDAPEFPDQDLQQLEAAIFAAGDYLRPSQDLRPRILDEARQQADKRSNHARVAGMALAALLLVAITTPLLESARRWAVQRTSPTATELQLRAAQIEQPEQTAAQWGLVEAFAQLRRFQADRVGITSAQIK